VRRLQATVLDEVQLVLLQTCDISAALVGVRLSETKAKPDIVNDSADVCARLTAILPATRLPKLTTGAASTKERSLFTKARRKVTWRERQSCQR
jgi:hypothetical protein